MGLQRSFGTPLLHVSSPSHTFHLSLLALYGGVSSNSTTKHGAAPNQPEDTNDMSRSRFSFSHAARLGGLPSQLSVPTGNLHLVGLLSSKPYNS